METNIELQEKRRGYKKKYYKDPVKLARKHAQDKQRREDGLKRVYAQLGNKCEYCGNTDDRVLCVHHKNGRKGAYDYLVKDYDLTKIQLLCANCHAIIHKGMKYRDNEYKLPDTAERGTLANV